MRSPPGLCEFLRLCPRVAIAKLAKEPGRNLDDRLGAPRRCGHQGFPRGRSTNSLAQKFPATRSLRVAAGPKGNALVSVCANGPKSVALVGGRAPDNRALGLRPWVRGRILLAELGQHSHRHFAKIASYGDFFVSCLKENADPFIVRSRTFHRGRAIDSEGKHRSEGLPCPDRGVMDTYPREAAGHERPRS